MAFYNKGLGDLLYVEASDADGAAWNAAETADSSGDVGHYASLIELSGKPAIAYAQAVLGLSPPVYEAVKFACKY